MFTFEQIKELVELASRHRLHDLEIEHADFRLRITGELQAVAAPPPAAVAPAGVPIGAGAPVAAPVAALAGTVAPPAAAAPLHVVASPIVGTFYASPSPDSAAYVRVGERVSKGQVLCIIEAMKLMNEIECDTNGVVIEVYPKNAQPVEYGEPLFGIRTDD
jgi:acetyl-CoA carboxylase biotin carboxyl carrier protein